MIPPDLEETQPIARTVFDPLEETQDISGRTVAGEYHTNGVFRIDYRAGYECHRYAPELSERYPIDPIRLTVRQAE